MRLYRAKDYNDMSRKAAHIISAQVTMKPDCVLGLATGSTPIGTYIHIFTTLIVHWNYPKGFSPWSPSLPPKGAANKLN